MVYRKEVKITKIAKAQVIDHFEHIAQKFMNPLAADSFLKAYLETLERLSIVADGLPICENKDLALYEFRIIHFKKYHYKILYRVKGDIVIVDAVYHNRQKIKIPKDS